LAPTAEFESLALDLSVRHRDAFALIRAVSKGSLLSLHAAAIRLVEVGLLTQSQLAAWVRTIQPAKEKEEEKVDDAFGAPHAKRVGEIGYLPTYVAKLAFEQKLVDQMDIKNGIFFAETLQDAGLALASRRMVAALKG
jgi:hypothetical protein